MNTPKNEHNQIVKATDVPLDGTLEQLERFFTPQIVERQLLFTPEVDLNAADSFGAEENVPGFVFIGEPKENYQRTGNTIAWEQGRTEKDITLGGFPVRAIASYAYFPANMFDHIVITQEAHPNAFSALMRVFNVNKPQMAEISVDNPDRFQNLDDFLGS